MLKPNRPRSVYWLNAFAVLALVVLYFDVASDNALAIAFSASTAPFIPCWYFPISCKAKEDDVPLQSLVLDFKAVEITEELCCSVLIPSMIWVCRLLRVFWFEVTVTGAVIADPVKTVRATRETRVADRRISAVSANEYVRCE